MSLKITQSGAIALIVFCTLLTSSAQVLLKIGVGELPPSLGALSADPLVLLLNWQLLLALTLYAAGYFIVIIAMRHGELSVLYPILATSYIWVTFLSAFFFAERISVLKFLGVGAILLGITCIGMSSKSADIRSLRGARR